MDLILIQIQALQNLNVARSTFRRRKVIIDTSGLTQLEQTVFEQQERDRPDDREPERDDYPDQYDEPELEVPDYPFQDFNYGP